SSTASTPCDSTVSRWTSSISKLVSYRAIPASRSSTATPMWSILPNMRRSLRGGLGADDLGHRREADLELLGARLLRRQQTLDFPAGGVEGLGERLAVVAIAPG